MSVLLTESDKGPLEGKAEKMERDRVREEDGMTVMVLLSKAVIFLWSDRLSTEMRQRP